MSDFCGFGSKKLGNPKRNETQTNQVKSKSLKNDLDLIFYLFDLRLFAYIEYLFIINDIFI